MLAPLCLLASVLASEGGVGTFAYLLAYEIALATGRARKRVLALAPAVAVTVLWRVVYDLQGYGADGGGFYVDPVREPLAYLVAVYQRAPFLLAGQWLASPPELHSLVSSHVQRFLCLVLAVPVVLIPLGLRPLFRGRRRMWFWLVGMHGAVLPVCAAIPMARGMLFVALGGFGLIAECLGIWFGGDDREPRPSRPGPVLGVLLTLLLLVHLPLAAATRAGAYKVNAKMTKWLNKATVMHLLGQLPPDQDLVVVNAPNPAALLQDPFRAATEGKIPPSGLRMLAPGYGPLEIVRAGPRRLIVRSLSDSLLECPPTHRIDPVYFARRLSDVKDSGRSLKVGQRIALPRMTVEVLATGPRGTPSEALFAFDKVLEDRTLLWLYWNWGHRHFVIFRPPPVGRSVCLRGPF